MRAALFYNENEVGFLVMPKRKAVFYERTRHVFLYRKYVGILEKAKGGGSFFKGNCGVDYEKSQVFPTGQREGGVSKL